MELGLNFDDSMFEETRAKTVAAPISYNAKFCPPQWFNGAEGQDFADQLQLLKYQTDSAYHVKDFDHALKVCQTALGLLPNSNSAMGRDLMECAIRCHIAMKQPDMAMFLAQKLHSGSVNFEQWSSTLSLLVQVFKAQGNLLGSLVNLQRITVLHPLNAHVWIELSDVYSEYFQNYQCTCKCPTPQDAVLSFSGNTSSTTDSQEQLNTKNCAHVPFEANQLEKCSTAMNELAIEDNAVCQKINNMDETASCHQRHCSNGGNFTDGGYDVVMKVNQHSDTTFCRFKKSTLVMATCLLRARLLLAGVEKCVNSFVKTRNQKLQEQISTQIHSLDLSQEKLDHCEKFLCRDIYGVDEDSKDKLEDPTLIAEKVIHMKNSMVQEEFENKWFSWS